MSGGKPQLVVDFGGICDLLCSTSLRKYKWLLQLSYKGQVGRIINYHFQKLVVSSSAQTV